MKRKEVLVAAVVGGCIGAVLTMSVGLFMPVGVVAQSYNHDATFGTITCRRIEVVELYPTTKGEWRDIPMVIIGSDEDGGSVTVWDYKRPTGVPSALLSLHEKKGELRALMGVNEYGNGVVATWDKNGYRQ